MKKRTKIAASAFITLASAFYPFVANSTPATFLPSSTMSGGIYLSYSSVSTVANLSKFAGVGAIGDLLSLAGRGLAQTFTAALTEPAPAGWTRESAIAPKPAARPSIAAAPRDGGVFGSVAIPFKRLAALKRLAPSLEEMTDGTAISCDAGKCSNAAVVIKAAFTKTSQASIRDKMNTVNNTVNHAIRYKRDIETYKVADYWATPTETIARQQGDCEDFAILKMAALHAEGVDLKDMAIVVLFDQKRHFYHAVLSVSVEGNRFILDNMRDEVLPDTRLPDYMPLYSIAGGKGFIHGSRVGGGQMASAMPIEKVAPGEGVAF
ncbi:hypothetical protein ASE04_16030 [Rhizobium sp. Root708]|nr:hypothetical protein ASE04_16030 [Rhizobium sp. Root708]